MMNKREVFEIVSEYLVKEFEVPKENVRPEANLFTDLELDSIDALDWFSEMEARMGLPILEEELKEVRTVQDVVDYVVRNLESSDEGRH
jgi:acyl carrier protein